MASTTEIYSLTVLEAGNQKSRCWQGLASSEGSRGGAFLSSFSSSCSWRSLVVAESQLLPPASFGLLPCVSLCSVFSLTVSYIIRVFVIIFRVYPNLQWPFFETLILIISLKISTPLRSHVTYLLLGGYNFTLCTWYWRLAFSFLDHILC